MKVSAKIRVDHEPARRASSRFLLRVPIPTNKTELEKDWLIDGEPVQRDTLDRSANGETRTVMASVMATHGGAHELTMIDGQGAGRRHIGLPSSLSGLVLVIGARGSERFKCRPVDGEATYRYTKDTGPLVRTEAHWSRFRRDSDGKELLGVWAFVTYRADDVTSIVFNVSNAAAKATPDGVVGIDGKVYYNGIYMDTPDGQSWISDHERPSIKPDQGWLVAPLENGKDHMIAPRAHFYRRVALFTDGDPDSLVRAQEVLRFDGYGFAHGEASYYERGHGQTQISLPRISDSYRSSGGRGLEGAQHEAVKNLSGLEVILREGREGSQMMETEALGWAHPMGSHSPGMPGGWWIFATGAPFQLTDETRHVSLCMIAHAERETIWALDADTGHPLGQHDFSKDGPMNFLIADTGALRNEGTTIPGWDANPGNPWNSGDCPYEEALARYLPEDAQHGIRNVTQATSLYYATGDAAAQFHLRAWAEHHILARTNLPHPPWSWHPTKLVTNFERLPWVKENQHEGGVTGGRDTAWISNAAATYFGIAPLEWREQMDDWFTAESIVIWLGSMPNGIGTWTDKDGHVHRSAMHREGSTVTDADGVHQAFEIGLTSQGIMALIVNVWQGRAVGGELLGIHDGLASVIVNSAKFLSASQLSNNRHLEEDENPQGGEAPPWYVNVRNVETGEPIEGHATRWAGGGEGLHGHFHLLYAYLLDDDVLHLQRAFNLVGGPGPRGREHGEVLAIREGSWYADKVMLEISWGRPLLLHHAAGLVALMQKEWAAHIAPPASDAGAPQRR